MLLRSSPQLSPLTLEGESIHRGRSLCASAQSLNAFRSSNASASSVLRLFGRNVDGRFVIKALNEANNRAVLDVVFEPFEEVKKELLLVPTVPQQSLGRHKYSDECENAINEQINVEYNVSYVYHAMYAYFDRDNVALKGLAKFFKDSSEEERQHAEKLMEYQNKRGGKVRLQSILMPLSEYDHLEKGDALYGSLATVGRLKQRCRIILQHCCVDEDYVKAMELALSLEKLTNEKLLNLHKVADKSNDVQLTDFVESEFLVEQVEAIKKMSEYVSQLRRVGKGHGVWDFDQKLLAGLVAA